MTKTNNLIKEVFKDFNGEVGKRVKILTFLNKISKSKVFILKKLELFIIHQISMQKKVYLHGQKKYIRKKLILKKGTIPRIIQL